METKLEATIWGLGFKARDRTSREENGGYYILDRYTASCTGIHPSTPYERSQLRVIITMEKELSLQHDMTIPF